MYCCIPEMITTKHRQCNNFEAAGHACTASSLIKFSFRSKVQPEYHCSNCIRMTDGHDLKMTCAFASRSLGTTYVYFAASKPRALVSATAEDGFVSGLRRAMCNR